MLKGFETKMINHPMSYFYYINCLLEGNLTNVSLHELNSSSSVFNPKTKLHADNKVSRDPLQCLSLLVAQFWIFVHNKQSWTLHVDLCRAMSSGWTFLGWSSDSLMTSRERIECTKRDQRSKSCDHFGPHGE